MVAITVLELRQGIRRIRNNINISIHTNQFHSTLIPTHTTQTLHPILPTLALTTSVAAAVALNVVVLRIRPQPRLRMMLA
jgi:hypothetical protein